MGMIDDKKLFHNRLTDTSGQMTVDLVVSLPVLIVVALIAVNVLFMLSQCASFDRVARDAVRVVAASPTYEQSLEQSAAQIKQVIENAFSEGNTTSFSVSAIDGYAGVSHFDIMLEYHPTLFGMGLRTSLWGIPLPTVKHTIQVAVDPYKPGVVI